MANNDDFKQFVIKGVKLVYPKINHTYRYNPDAGENGRSEPCPPTAQGAAWSIGWEMPMADARALHAQLKAHYGACRPKNPKLPAFSKVFGMKKLEDGQTVQFRAKRMGTKKDGMPNSPPKVVNGQKERLEDLDFWSGSVGSVMVNAFPTMDKEKTGGVSLILNAVQVTQPIYGSDGLDDFDEVTTGSDDLDDFGPSPAPSPARQQAPAKPVNEVLGDDIPF